MSLNKTCVLTAALLFSSLSFADSGSLAERIVNMQKVANLAAEIEAIKSETKKFEAKTAQYKAKYEMEQEENRRQLDEKAKALKSAEDELAQYKELMSQMNSQKGSGRSGAPALNPQSSIKPAKALPPAFYVLETASGGKSKPKAKLQAKNGNIFTVRSGTTLQGWRVSSIESGIVTLVKGDEEYAYSASGLLQ